MDNLRRIPLTDRIQNIGYLIKNSVTIVGADWSILKPMVTTSILGIVQAAVFLAGLGMAMHAVLVQDNALWGTSWLVLLAAAVLWFGKFFYFIGSELRQSAIVHRRIVAGDASAAAADTSHGGAVWRLALLDIAMAYAKYARNRKSGGLINLILSGFLEVWDLVSHYVLPAIAIDGLSIRESIGRIKELRDRVPATLAGVFGIDLFGRVAAALAAPIYGVMVPLAIFLSWYLASVLPSGAFPVGGGELPDFLLTDGALVISVVPLFVAAFLGKAGSIIVARGVTWVKVNYFTLFYLQITHPDRIRDDLQDELVQYLRMEKPEPETADEAVKGSPAG